MTTALYEIEYSLHGEPKHFIIRADRMDNAEAWHWASCDVGVAQIPKNRHDKVRKLTKPMAERFGIADVKWRLCPMLASEG
jgi:hypothetical protein